MCQYVQFSTLDVGFCVSSSFYQLDKRINTANECWGNCTEIYTVNVLEAVEYYTGVENMVEPYPNFNSTQCFCDLSCLCLIRSASSLEEGVIMFPDDDPKPDDCGDAGLDDSETDKLEVLLLATFTSLAFVVCTVGCGYYFSRYKPEEPPSLRTSGKSIPRATDITVNPIRNRPTLQVTSHTESGASIESTS